MQKLAVDYNLITIIAEAFYQQFALYFEEYANVTLSTGEIAYEAVAAEEPAGKHIRLFRKITVILSVMDFNTDLDVLAEFGLTDLRRHRIARITRQTYDQGAFLSYGDLVMLLTISPVTIIRDIYHLHHQGMFIMTRGTKHDMRLGLSHKTVIINFYKISQLTRL